MNGYLKPYGGIYCIRDYNWSINNGYGALTHWGFNFLVKWSKGGIEVWERIG